MADTLTAEEAEAALAKFGPDDLAFVLRYAQTHEVDPVWRAALDEARAREGGGRKSRDHRRGRRG